MLRSPWILTRLCASNYGQTIMLGPCQEGAVAELELLQDERHQPIHKRVIQAMIASDVVPGEGDQALSKPGVQAILRHDSPPDMAVETGACLVADRCARA